MKIKFSILFLGVISHISNYSAGFWPSKDGETYWCKRGHFNFDQANFFCNLLPVIRPKYILETGFCTGRSAVSILLSHKPIKFISIDINLDYISPEGRIFAKKLTENFKCFQIIEADSRNILNKTFFKTHFPNGIDWITIDGGHSFEECYNDLDRSSEFLNQNGIIIVDDYKSGPPNGGTIETVTNAVDAFVKKNKQFNKLEWYNKGKGFAILFKSYDLYDLIKEAIIKTTF